MVSLMTILAAAVLIATVCMKPVDHDGLMTVSL